jgi:hypothetical protein
MPNQIPQIVEERIVAFSLGHPGLGPRRIAAQLARPEWGGLIKSSASATLPERVGSLWGAFAGFAPSVRRGLA